MGNDVVEEVDGWAGRAERVSPDSSRTPCWPRWTGEATGPTFLAALSAIAVRIRCQKLGEAQQPRFWQRSVP